MLVLMMTGSYNRQSRRGTSLRAGALAGDYDEPVSGAQAESGPDLRVIPSASAAPGVGGGALAAATLGGGLALAALLA